MLPKPKNQFAQALLLLIEKGNMGATMLDACQDRFHKFQTRLLEVEREHPKLKIRRLKMTTKNRYGHPCTYTNYKAISPYPYLKNLYEKLNRKGLKK